MDERTGFQLLLRRRGDILPTDETVHVRPGTVAQVSLKLHGLNTTDEARKMLSAGERGCYFDNEFKSLFSDSLVDKKQYK